MTRRVYFAAGAALALFGAAAGYPPAPEGVVMAALDWLLSGFRRYRQRRGGEWFEVECPGLPDLRAWVRRTGRNDIVVNAEVWT